MGHKEIALELICELNEDEMQMRAQQLAEAMKDYRSQLEEIAERMRILSRALRTRAEQRMVQCAIEFHRPSVGFKRTIRLDTGELVREEEMTSEERQRHLFEPPNEEA